MTEKNISFIIPVYNEECNILSVLNDIHSVIQKNPHWNAEVIVIEDGSQDNTRQVILNSMKTFPDINLILHEKNMGYTMSLKDGIDKAEGKYLMYIGADEEFDCSELPTFVEPLLKNDADVVLGVRWQRNAYQLFRFFLSVIYIFLLNYMFKMRVNDYNWSQAWSKKLFQQIKLKSTSLFVLPEIIIKAYDLNLRIKEVPSNHRGRRHGKSSLNFKIMHKALTDAFKFYFVRKSANYSPVI